MQPVTLQIRWPQLFGEKPTDIAPEERRKRWGGMEGIGHEVGRAWSSDGEILVERPY